MDFTLTALLLALGLFAGMVALLELGRYLGRRKLERDAEQARAGLGAIEGAVFGLFGLLVAFTFAGAAGRFDERRALITAEANAVGTTWQRVDTLPADAQPLVRDLFRSYMDARLAAYRAMPDLGAAMEHLEESGRIEARLWSAVVDACRTDAGRPALMLVLPAFNETFDIATDRFAATKNHPPTVIFVMLAVLALVAALLAGHAMAGAKSQSWIHTIGFAAIVALTFYVILDLEYPRLGLIRLDAADQILIDTRNDMR